MFLFVRFMSAAENADVSEAIRALKGFPDLRLPSRGLKDLKVKSTATERGNMFKCLPVALLAAPDASRALDCIHASSGER